MRRGDICFVEFDPARGSETNKRRPAIIVSNDNANEAARYFGRGVVSAVPLTSNTRRVFPFQVFLPSSVTGLRLDSKAQAEQVRSIDIERIGAAVGHVPPELLRSVEAALRLHLSL